MTNPPPDKDVELICKAITCGRTVRDTFGGNVGGGKCVFKEGLEALSHLTTRTDTLQRENEEMRTLCDW